ARGVPGPDAADADAAQLAKAPHDGALSAFDALLLLARQYILDLERARAARPVGPKDAVLAIARGVRVLHEHDHEARQQETKDAQALAVGQRRLLQQLEAQQRAIRVEV